MAVNPKRWAQRSHIANFRFASRAVDRPPRRNFRFGRSPALQWSPAASHQLSAQAAVCYVRPTSTPAVRRIGARSYAPASHCLATKVLTKPACGIPSARNGAGDCAGVRQGLAEDPLARVKLLEFASVDPAADAIAEGLQSARIHTQRANSPSLRLRQEFVHAATRWWPSTEKLWGERRGLASSSLDESEEVPHAPS